MEDYWSKMSEIHKTPPPQDPEKASAEPPRWGPPPAWGGVTQAAPTQPPAPRYGEGPGVPRGPRRRGSERAARLTITCLAASFAVLVVGLVVFFTVRTLRQSDDNPVTSTSGPTGTTPEDAARVVGGVGPPAGADLQPYAEARKAALATATGDRLAVVSLPAYTTEAKARAAVGSVEVVALLAAAPGGAPSVVTTNIATWANAQTAEAKAERDEMQRLIPTVKDDPAFQTFYRSEVDRLNKLVSRIKPDGDLVFGVVVKAPVLTLQQLGAKPEIRLVDVGPGIEPAPRSDYRGIRPEETTKANDPNTRPF